jgi:hypothetical protein
VPGLLTLTPSRRDGLLLTALAFALALVQRPGRATSETKIDLHVDPVGFLADAASLWSPTADLGHVHGGQYSGYLFPMGPVFALGRLAGLAPWLVQRLWLGAVLAVAAWGVVRLVDAMVEDAGTPARITAGLLTLCNPYVVVFANRTSITLLAYATLPWLLLAVHRGVRSPRSWWWPAVAGLVAGASGGGVNVAVIGWLLLAPAGLAVYEAATGAVAWRDVRGFALRAAACLAVACAWWVVPVAAHALYGRDFLAFTEQPGAIWSTTSASEALRLMGYWTSYIGVGYGGLRPYTSDAGVLLFWPPVVLATLLVPAAALGSHLLARSWRYGPFCLLLVLAGTLIVMVGFPDGTPLRRAALGLYFHVQPVQFLRTTYKAAPLIALGLALLSAAAAGPAWAALGRRRIPAAALGLLVLALAAWPLVRGKAIEPTLSWEEIPAAWTATADELDAGLAPGSRALVVPGELFGWQRWGGTVDPLLPALTDRPVTQRGLVPFADLRAVDTLQAVDSLLQQEKLVPGQLEPLLALLGVRALVLDRDGDPARTGAVRAERVEAQLRERAGLPEPDADHGALARFDVDAGPGIVQVLPDGPETIVDGSAPTLMGLAALGGLDPARPLFYAADRAPAQLRAAAEAGAELVIGDSNRHRVGVPAQTRQEAGPTVAAGEELPPGSAELQPFPDAGMDERTVAVYEGIRGVREDVLPSVRQFPEQRPFAALDGDEGTSWVAPDHPDESRHWLEVTFTGPRDVGAIELVPHADPRGRTTAVAIAGRSFRLRPGTNRLPVALRGVDRLRVRIAQVDRPAGVDRAAGGIAELRIPGLRPRELLRPPVRLERALAGADLDRSSLSYVFERTAAPGPFAPRAGRGVPQARRLRDGRDAEREIARRIAPPAARTWTADGWAAAPAGGAAPVARCGAVTVRAGAAELRLRPASGPPGAPVALEPCGDPVRLPDGPVDVVSESVGFRPLWIRLRSEAPAGLPAPSGGGTVTAPGAVGRSTVRDAAVQLDGPAWLVLGQSWDRGWRARCDGRDLGAPEPVQGYANGWRVEQPCTAVAFAYAPDRPVKLGMLLSALGALALLGFVVLRRRPALAPAAAAGPDPVAADRPPRASWRGAAALGAVAAVAGAALIALRAGPVVGLAVLLVARQGVGARPLHLAGVALLGVAVPLVYVLATPEDRGGFASAYATDLIAAHWLAMAALVLIALGLWRTLSGWRAARASPGRVAAARGRAPGA